MPKRKPEPVAIDVDTFGQITVPLGGAEYTLRPSYQAIEECELQTGLSLFDLAGLAANCRLSLPHVGIVLAAMMRAHGKETPNAGPSYADPKPEKLSKLAYEAGLPRIVLPRLAVLLAGALNGGFTASGEVKTSGT